MRGWAIEVGEWLPEFDNEVVGVVVESDFPQRRLIADTISECPWECVWVARATDELARDALNSAGKEHVVAGLNPFWKNEKKDVRSLMRECEMLYGCTFILVFARKKGQYKKIWRERPSARAKITVIER